MFWGPQRPDRECEHSVRIPMVQQLAISTVSVPKILTLFIPEILSHPARAGRAKTLPVPLVRRPVGRREEDVRNAKASRSRDLAEGRSLQDRSSSFGRNVPVLG